MAKASKKAVVLRHEPTGLYYSKTAGLTENLFSAMSFADDDNATQFIRQSYYRPIDPDNYKPYEVVTTKEVVEHVQDECQHSQPSRSAG